VVWLDAAGSNGSGPWANRDTCSSRGGDIVRDARVTIAMQPAVQPSASTSHAIAVQLHLMSIQGRNLLPAPEALCRCFLVLGLVGHSHSVLMCLLLLLLLLLPFSGALPRAVPLHAAPPLLQLMAAPVTALPARHDKTKVEDNMNSPSSCTAGLAVVALGPGHAGACNTCSQLLVY
jgi:hypothetical protein